MKLPWVKRPAPEPRNFTGTCRVKEHDGMGRSCGACYHSTYDGVCHRHGDVSRWLYQASPDYDQWPNDFEL